MATTPDLAPASWIDSFSENGTAISVPLASFGLDAADADATSGDIRIVVQSIVQTILDAYAGYLEVGGIDPTGTRPTGMTVTRSDAIVFDTTSETDVLRTTYSVRINQVLESTGLITEPPTT